MGHTFRAGPVRVGRVWLDNIRLHKDSKPFQVSRGVRQGDTSSPKLFTACLEKVFRKLNWSRRGILIDGEYLSHLRFADDIIIFTRNIAELHQMLQELNQASLEVGLSMNFKKTKIMRNKHAEDTNRKITIDSNEIEEVDHYIYLGQRISMETASKEQEIKRRITLGWQAFGRASAIFKNKEIPTCLKRQVYNECIIPTVTYGSETWNLTKIQSMKLRSMQRAHERIMLNITWRDHKTAEWIREQTKLRDILETINNSPSDLSDYRPIAITSVVMKCFEKIVLHHLLDLTKGMQDPFQFAYKPNRSIEDAILTLLHNTFLHTNNPKSYVRILFADFSSAFNTIKPYHLAKKLVRLNISPKLVIWIINFLSHRKQFVRFKGVLSGERSISTGVPQGCVLSPVLFTLYTNDCTGTENTIFIKYSDDTAIVDLSNSIPHYIEEVDRFTTWCKANFLDLNVAKTKELLIDFRKQPPAVSPITIDGEIVERVEKYKYLGIILDNKLKFDSNVLNIYKKCHYRIYCLQRLRNIGINSKILALYYQSCVETLVTSCLICWYGSVNLRSKKLLNNIVKVCSKTVGIEQKSLHNIFNNSVKKKAKVIMSDRNHALSMCYELLPSGRRYRCLKVKPRTQKSFIPYSIRLLNSTS